jgi:hypothetical protein
LESTRRRVFLRHEPQSLIFSDGNDHWSDPGQDLAAREAADYFTEIMR